MHVLMIINYIICLIQCRILIIWGELDFNRFISQRFEYPPVGAMIHKYEHPGVYQVCLGILNSKTNTGTTVCEYVTVH